MVNVENGFLQSAIDNAAVGEVLMLTSDIVLDNRVSVSDVVTIDLNGYTISSNVDDGYGAIYVRTNGDLTIVDSSPSKTGSIVNAVGNAIGNYGSVAIYSGTFTGNYALYNFYYSDTIYGKSTIYGGTFKSVDGSSLSVANCGNLNIVDGVVESVDTTNTLIITGGAIKSLNIGVADYDPPTQNTSVKGGHINALTVEDGSNNKLIVSGGTFDTEIDSKYLADGVKFTYDKNTGSYVAKTSQGLKLIATSSSKVRNLAIKDGQLIFIQDSGRIAFDFKGKRVFYNQIVELKTEVERLALDSPLPGYYFVIDTGILWHYDNKWNQISGRPDEIVFIGVELPKLGQAKEGMLYVNKADKEIAVFDSASNDYMVVSNFTHEATDEDIDELFN